MNTDDYVIWFTEVG